MLERLRDRVRPRLARLDDRGASAIEYGLLVAGIAVLIVAVLFVFGGKLATVLSEDCTSSHGSASCG